MDVFLFFINLQHHCRKCGGIFCASCTSKRTSVLNLPGDRIPRRVCDRCYTVLLEDVTWGSLKMPLTKARTYGSLSPRFRWARSWFMSLTLLWTHGGRNWLATDVLTEARKAGSSTWSWGSVVNFLHDKKDERMIFFPWFTIFPRLFFSFKLFLFRNIVLCATGLRKKTFI